ncbi:MAG: outer membrane beta-barrel protein [Crocinitomicaceae bacterium]|nr:outer membrane beta-barrel protein [Flavobacteriales bacterium]NQZ34229.1 outer membrane beta-barrel protein [Crocinitomicaceae bacterium]
MKKILLFMGVIALGSTAMAQTQVGQGDVIIDPYIGVPNWANSILYNDLNILNNTDIISDYKVNGGQLSYGGRVEYMLSDDFGMGVDINYEVSGFNYNATRSVLDTISGNYVDAKYNYDYTAKKFRAMVRLNYHFVQTDRADAYTSFGAGYKNVNRTTLTNDPDVNSSSNANLSSLFTGTFIPISFRLAVGTRIYITNNFGINLELGVFGGGLIQFGATFKIPTY